VPRRDILSIWSSPQCWRSRPAVIAYERSSSDLEHLSNVQITQSGKLDSDQERQQLGSVNLVQRKQGGGALR
jgi:hypothetical protein